ncbi:protein of unknown function [Hyphomicrobium sp. MC1]|nr:protein of unknown function [Hyphomicrobium sp. MC1]
MFQIAYFSKCLTWPTVRHGMAADSTLAEGGEENSTSSLLWRDIRSIPVDAQPGKSDLLTDVGKWS